MLTGGVSFERRNNSPRGLDPISERAADPAEAQRIAADAISRSIRVAIPAKVVSFDAETQTITAQPLIREKVMNAATGDLHWVDMPELPGVPVWFPQGGPFAITFPIKEGDECLLVFMDLCIDSWLARGDVQNWSDRRRHDLSDAVALVGLNSQPNRLEDIANDALELRTKNGNIRFRITEEGLEMKVGDDLGIEIIDGILNFKGDVIINGLRFMEHIHSGVVTGPSFTDEVFDPTPPPP